MYKVEYAKGVLKDLKGLSSPIRNRALEVVEKILLQNPRLGKPLKGPYKGLWKFRMEDYRIIYSIEENRLVVFVLRIRHRKDVYHGIII